MKNEPQPGFAVVNLNTGHIYVETVQRTEIGAMVNGLVVLLGEVVLAGVSDDEVRAAWARARRRAPALLVVVAPVTISKAL